MAVDPILLGIPGFFLLIGVELLVARVRGRDLYRLGDALCNIGTGILDQILGLVTREVFPFTAYVLLFAVSPLRLDAHSPWTYVAAFVGADLAYYWWHRLSHTVNFLWAGHVVHHQSEEFNLSVALRQNWVAGLTGAFFYLPLALLGVPPAAFALMRSFMILYQFWIHTELVGRLGPLEWIFNCPSHHRVHHGINPRYVDKNYAGTFIVWDRLFGTFEPETERPVYGVLRPFTSWNPVWAVLEPWAYLWRAAAAAPRWQDKLKIWWAHPAWHPGLLAPLAPDPVLFAQVRAAQQRRTIGAARAVYLVAQFALVLGAAVLFLFTATTLPDLLRWACVAWLALSLAGLAAVSERRPHAPVLEAARWVLALPLAYGIAHLAG